MPYRRNGDWADQVPPATFRSPYQDYGWEPGESVLPEFRGPEVHRMRQDRETRTSLHGPHRGKGPKGYRRSDQRILDDVCGRLTQHGYIDARDMQVSVDNGEVTLKGTVDSRYTKRLTEDVVDSVAGVQDVHNQLTIRRELPPR